MRSFGYGNVLLWDTVIVLPIRRLLRLYPAHPERTRSQGTRRRVLLLRARYGTDGHTASPKLVMFGLQEEEMEKH